MHQFSLDTDTRKQVYIVLAVLAGSMPGAAVLAAEWVRILWASLPYAAWPLSMGATYGFLFLIFDRFAWRLPGLRVVLGIPDLNGVWQGAGLGSYQQSATGEPTASFELTLTVRQTFTRIEFHAETTSSTSRSTMASICTDRAVPLIRYAFENVPKNRANAELQRHPGMMELRLTNDELVGDYFSGKHRLRFGELRLKRKTLP